MWSLLANLSRNVIYAICIWIGNPTKQLNSSWYFDSICLNTQFEFLKRFTSPTFWRSNRSERMSSNKLEQIRSLRATLILHQWDLLTASKAIIHNWLIYTLNYIYWYKLSGSQVARRQIKRTKITMDPDKRQNLGHSLIFRVSTIKHSCQFHHVLKWSQLLGVQFRSMWKFVSFQSRLSFFLKC